MGFGEGNETNDGGMDFLDEGNDTGASNQAPAGNAGNSFEEAAQIPGALHAAAKQGNAENVNFLLRNKADPDAVDTDGRNAVQVAQAAGHVDVVQILNPVSKIKADAGGVTNMAGNAETGGATAAANTSWDNIAGDSGGAGGAGGQMGHSGMGATGMHGMGNAGKSPKSASSPALGSYADLKAKTAFAGASVDGVLKRTTYMTQFSNYRSSPKYTLAPRGQNMFVRSSQTPAPGTYNLPPEEKSKYKMPPRFSFGGSSRFGLGESPAKKQPGPGQYNPVDPSLTGDTKVGFGTAVRGKGALVAQANPGPGAYEYRSCMGQGQMFTAGGRHPTSYMRARSLPGPGAYNPMTQGVFSSPPKAGFGTSTRDDIGTKTRNLVMPGPGTYELQNFKGVGTDSAKFSATSRRRLHDLNSYVTPGPGAYNAHCTSFGY